MPFDRFLIAPINTGKQTNLRPFLIPDDAFEELNNAYVFRGRVVKRFGGKLTGNGAPNAVIAPLYSRLAINVGITDGAGNIGGVVPSAQTKIGSQFRIGTQIFTVYQLGVAMAMLISGTATLATYDTFTGAFVINGAAPLTAVYFYPGSPVMGLTTYDKKGVPINDQPAYAFDTQFAYVFDSALGFWIRSGTAVWHGDNSNFFWAFNWRGVTPDVRAMFVTNYFVVNPFGAGNVNDDPIWYTPDGINWFDLVGPRAFYFRPASTGVPGPPQTGPFVKTARIIVGFKNRLVLLNTIENDGIPVAPNFVGTDTNTQYVNRVRWSSYGSPFAPNAWYEIEQSDNAGTANSDWSGAAYLDAPTDEAIVSAEFIKDRLIVFFERSTWELVYVQNQTQTFAWQKINTELGSEATFSSVPFDRHILTMSNAGVHACNGANVERIDTKIPDEIFSIRNKNEGVKRVAGVRDFFTEMVYWTFPSIDQQGVTPTFPNKVLVYNYRNGSWALNDDSITVFGYFNQQLDITWATDFDMWQNANYSWDSATQQAQFRQVIAGNQEGFVFIVDSLHSRNAPVFQITNIANDPGGFIILTIIDHNLIANERIAIENAFNNLGILGIPSPTIVNAFRIIDTNTVWAMIEPEVFTQFNGTYVGGGTATKVSNVNFTTKQFNPYLDTGRNVYLARVDFAVKRTTGGQITVDYLASSNEQELLQEAVDTEMVMGNSILETSAYLTVPFEAQQKRVWHPIYFQSDGEYIQLFFYFNEIQLGNPVIAWDDFQLEAMVLHTQATSQRLQ